MEKFDSNYVQVLWVEDDPGVTFAYPFEAANYGLQLVPFSCWDDAKTALEKDYNRWCAIILDAKCKQHRDSVDNAVRFLGEALKDIASLSKERRRVIPWYVFTGGAESEVSDSITDDRLKWDADWTESTNKKYYSKNVDNVKLFERIKDHANKSPRLQIQEMYRDSYEQLKNLNSEVCEDILTIFEAIHFPDIHPDFTPRLFYNPLRQALEYVFRLAQSVGIIPDDFFKESKVNINQCFMFLIGREAKMLGYKHRGGGITPNHIQNMMSLIINLGNANSHSSESNHATELSDDEIQNYESHIKSIGGNPKLLIFSIALQFCEILHWMNNYITENSDKDKNREMWVPLKPLFEGIIEIDDGILHIGENYAVPIKYKALIGKRVQIFNYVKNINSKTKKYKFFVREQDLKVLDDE